MPIISVLEELDEEDLVRVLKEPKNSLIKQYTKLLDMDNTSLVQWNLRTRATLGRSSLPLCKELALSRVF